jgi:hypothetical protein
MTCVRRAWLTLGTLSVDLEDAAAGYYCTSLDLGSPDVRDVMNNRPDQDGADDRTLYFGSRAIAADITATEDVDTVASSFAPFMVPSARPVLHYVLDLVGAPERTLVVRASSYSSPIAGPGEREIQLQWIAADPIAKDATTRTATAYTGAPGLAGRTYDLLFPRSYPSGGGSSANATFTSYGDVPVRPLVRIYGPVTAPVVTFTPGGQLVFLSGFAIGAGEWVDVDCVMKTLYRNGDPAQNVAPGLDWAATVWPVLPVHTPITMSMTGNSPMSGVTQAQVIWHDGYLA